MIGAGIPCSVEFRAIGDFLSLIYRIQPISSHGAVKVEWGKRTAEASGTAPSKIYEIISNIPDTRESTSPAIREKRGKKTGN
jgi:hypothetical protein